MKQADQLIELFRRNNNVVTLKQILNTTLAAEYRARMTDLRKHGYVFTCHRRKPASINTYVMSEPTPVGAKG